MRKCRYCAKPSGIFRGSHKECKALHKKGLTEIATAIKRFENYGGDPNDLESEIRHIAKYSFITVPGAKQVISKTWVKLVDDVFDDGVLSRTEENALAQIKNQFSLRELDLDRKGSHTRVAQGAVLREVLEGNLPTTMVVVDPHPFNLQKSEQIVWMFNGVDYYEQKTRTEYRGGSKGMSVRVAKGLYVRVGAFKGRRVQTSKTMLADTGLLGITNKHIYFAGPKKKFRINYRKIVAFEPFSDGIGVQRDAQTAKPQSFVTGDGWFVYNLVSNLAQM